MKLVINNNLHLSRMTEQRYLVTFHCTMGSCLHKTLWLAIIVTIELESCNIFCCPRVLSGHEFKYKSFLRMLVGAGLSHSLESYYCECLWKAWYRGAFHLSETDSISLSPVQKWSGQYLAFLQNSEGGAVVGSTARPRSSHVLLSWSGESFAGKIYEESCRGELGREPLEKQPREAGRK